jgi:hypothetical protein
MDHVIFRNAGPSEWIARGLWTRFIGPTPCASQGFGVARGPFAGAAFRPADEAFVTQPGIAYPSVGISSRAMIIVAARTAGRIGTDRCVRGALLVLAALGLRGRGLRSARVGRSFGGGTRRDFGSRWVCRRRIGNASSQEDEWGDPPGTHERGRSLRARAVPRKGLA